MNPSLVHDTGNLWFACIPDETPARDASRYSLDN